jgi:hypothetical protein
MVNIQGGCCDDTSVLQDWSNIHIKSFTDLGLGNNGWHFFRLSSPDLLLQEGLSDLACIETLGNH